MNENDLRDYCAMHGYYYDKLNLTEMEKKQLASESAAAKNGKHEILDGFFAFPRYEWRDAMIKD